MLRVRASGLSDVGMTRTHNEDSFAIDLTRQLYVVADGMGGHSHGEIASRVAVETIRETVERTTSNGSPSRVLAEAIRSAHARVLTEIEKDAALQGMGTTVAGVLVQKGIAAVAHVGDSRVYLVRDGALELLTRDHTWVAEQVHLGFLSEEQARVHPLKNVVTRALGGEAEVEVDAREVELKGDDLLLLCSDGLTTMVPDSEILRQVNSDRSLEEMCRQLVEHANAHGGIDNVTIVMLRVEDVV